MAPLEAIATAKYPVLFVIHLQKQLSQRQSMAPLEAIATANYLLLAIFCLQKQLSQRLQPPLQR
jgi:hypothetical protein